MNIGLGKVEERHQASGSAELWSLGDIDITATERWGTRRDQPYIWRPTTISLRWSWIDDEWKCTSATLAGYRLRKDGSVGLRDEKLSLMHGFRAEDKEWSTHAPTYVRETEERLRPTSRVVSDA